MDNLDIESLSWVAHLQSNLLNERSRFTSWWASNKKREWHRSFYIFDICPVVIMVRTNLAMFYQSHALGRNILWQKIDLSAQLPSKDICILLEQSTSQKASSKDTISCITRMLRSKKSCCMESLRDAHCPPDTLNNIGMKNKCERMQKGMQTTWQCASDMLHKRKFKFFIKTKGAWGTQIKTGNIILTVLP